MTNAVFVDLPNLYNQLIKSGIYDPKIVRDYFLNWFDFDTLTQVLVGSSSNTRVFYSGRLGPSEARIDGNYLNQFVDRINKHRGVTAHDVNIPGTQRESFTVQCEKCGGNTIVTSNSEKGIDASLIVSLFDTMDSWETAYLLSGDADFVPAVASLSRRGKIVIGAGFSTASSALVRECFEYIDMQTIFFAKDISAYLLFRQGEFIEKWMTMVKPRTNGIGTTKLEVGFRWIPPSLIEIYYKGDYDFSILQNDLKTLPEDGIRINIHGGDDRSDNGTLTVGFDEFTKKRIEFAIKELDNRLTGIQITRDSAGGPYMIHRLTYRLDEQHKQYLQFIPDSSYQY